MDLYNKTAKEYNLRQSNPSTRHLRKWEEKVIKKYADGKILDIGCGTGYHLKFLESLGRSAIGIDLSKEMLLSNNSENLLQADAYYLPFKNKSFDTVLCMFSTFNLLGETALGEIGRVLGDNGNIIISVSSIWDKKCPTFLEKLRIEKIEDHVRRKTVHISKNILHMKLFEKEELITIMEKYGFKLRKLHGLFTYQRPYWGRFDELPLNEKIRLDLDNLQILSKFGTMYLCVFSKLD